jgi:hypothetical protein
VQGIVPALHQLPMQPRRFMRQAVHHLFGNAADQAGLQGDGGMLVGHAEGCLHARGGAGPQQADDPLGAVGQVLHQLDQAVPQGEQRRAGIACVVKRGARLDLHFLERQMDQPEIVFREIGEQCQGADAAGLAGTAS